MADAHVLILEDDPIWQQNVAQTLQPIAAALHTAATLAQAETLLQTCYFNVAVVDWSLVLGDAKDDQGAQFMQMLRSHDLTDTVRLVVLSAYPSTERLRAGFREFHVVDFLEKRSFDADALLHTVLDALARNHLDHDVEIEIEGGDGGLSFLWERLTWAQRESAEALDAELYDLLRRVLPDATRLAIRKLPAGQSGAGVLHVQPFFDSQAGVPVVVKFGKKDKIRREHANFQQHIEHFVAPHAGVRLVCALGRVMGVIHYQFIGAELNPENDFARFYERHAFEQIRHVLDNLFKVTCKRWYGNLEMPRQRRDLVEMYREGLRIEWDAVWQGMQELGIDPESEQLTFPGVAGALPNPRRWLEKRGNRLYFEVLRTVTHGDSNEHNILVTEDGRTWLIDFYRTGWSHILRDAVVLETAIKFNLAGNNDLTAFLATETVLLRQTQLDHLRIPTGHAQAKVLHTLAHLRRLAASLNGVSDDMAEYNASLLLATLNLLRFDFMRDHHQQVLLSAALLCQWLEGGPLHSPDPHLTSLVYAAQSLFKGVGFNIEDARRSDIFRIQSGEELNWPEREAIAVKVMSQERVDADAVKELAQAAPGSQSNQPQYGFLIYDGDLSRDALRAMSRQRRERRIIIPIHSAEISDMPVRSLDQVEAARERLLSLRSSWRYLHDPYASINSLTSPKWFFGRNRINEVTKLVDQVEAGVSYLGIIGQRRIGKSVLANQLALKCHDRQYPVAKMVCQPFSLRGMSYPGFLTNTIRELVRSIKAFDSNFAEPSPIIMSRQYTFETAPQFQKDVIDLLKSYQDQAKGSRRFVILLDDVDQIFPKPGSDDNAYEQYCGLAQILKSTVDASPQKGSVILVMIMEFSLMDRIDRFPANPIYQNPLYGRFRPKPWRVGFLERGDWEDMIQTIGSVVDLEFDKDALSRWYHFSAGHPEISRKIGSCLVEFRRDGKIGDRIGASDLNKALDYFVKDPLSDAFYLETTFWNDPLSVDLDIQKELLLELARHESCTMDEIMQLFRVDAYADTEGRALWEQRILAVIEHVVEVDMIFKDNESFRIRMLIFRDWIRHSKLGTEVVYS